MSKLIPLNGFEVLAQILDPLPKPLAARRGNPSGDRSEKKKERGAVSKRSYGFCSLPQILSREYQLSQRTDVSGATFRHASNHSLSGPTAFTKNIDQEVSWKFVGKEKTDGRQRLVFKVGGAGKSAERRNRSGQRRGGGPYKGEKDLHGLPKVRVGPKFDLKTLLRTRNSLGER